jgi:hypothetical protein
MPTRATPLTMTIFEISREKAYAIGNIRTKAKTGQKG